MSVSFCASTRIKRMAFLNICFQPLSRTEQQLKRDIGYISCGDTETCFIMLLCAIPRHDQGCGVALAAVVHNVYIHLVQLPWP